MSCACYGYPLETRAHLPECSQYSLAHDPFLPCRWKIHKLDSPDALDDPQTPWMVCQIRGPVPYGLHETCYHAAEWEHCVIWLAVRYGEIRRERRLLENAMVQRYGRPVVHNPATGRPEPVRPHPRAVPDSRHWSERVAFAFDVWTNKEK